METGLDNEAKSSLIVPATAAPAEANTIRRIEKNVVHRICSGQVIVTLATAVKELIENSIDAGARSVEIRLVEYGSKSIEVIDNGSGVKEEDFIGLCMKHHTSKITNFEDVAGVDTFGFRGEALSSLCALSVLQVITKHKSSHSPGFCIDYDHKGNIKCQKVCPRENGTTVILKNIFSTLPVRYMQFQKNIKREYQKLVNVLYGYCLIADGVRILCTNRSEKGVVSTVLHVPATTSVESKIASLFGAKQCSDLIPIHQEDDHYDEDIKLEFGLKDTKGMCPYTFRGLTSAPQKGRRANDRQYIFINSRPCDSIKIARIVNETFQSFCRNQYPFIFLDIRTKKSNVDANVNPDKRLIFIRNENLLHAAVKASLRKAWQASACPINQVDSINDGRSNFSLQSPILKRRRDNDSDIESSNLPEDARIMLNSNTSYSRPKESKGEKYRSSQRAVDPVSASPKSGKQYTASEEASIKLYTKSRSHLQEAEDEEMIDISDVTEGTDLDLKIDTDTGNSPVPTYLVEACKASTTQSTTGSTDALDSDDEVVILYDDEIEDFYQRKSVIIKYQIKDTVKQAEVSIGIETNVMTCYPKWELVLRVPNGSEALKSTSASHICNFKAKISADDNVAAEQELKKYITRDMFAKMKVLGQFNLGFIVAKHEGNLFLVDQHASDEKYNFESLESSLSLQTQRLISPVNLQLPMASENVIVDRMEVFKRNGFDFQVDCTGEKRIQMTQIPFSKGWTFGKDDVEELVALLQDAPEDAFYRPTRVREMLASRACRKSVMIGTSLSSQTMYKILNNMSTLNQPWNCPHGRPTIRHLLDLNMLEPLDWKKFNH